MKKILTMIIVCMLMCACGMQNNKSKGKVTITVSAAASLKNALGEIEKSFEQKYDHIDVKFNYGATGALAQQIKSGAPVDIFLSAAQDKMDDLIRRNVVDKNDVKVLLKNHLVLISTHQLKSVKDLNDDTIKKIAIGNPDVVPAGKYGEQALEKLNVYEAIHPKLVFTKDVRQVLTYVETGNAEAGIIYTSDLKASNKVKYHLPIQSQLHEPIYYPIAKIKSTKHKEETALLYRYLQSRESKKVYQKYGFDIK
ncbi:molybdate ABC transporter substrate-binding protein [Macrococcoides caseolyticum]|uniref:molybdate ABC transporter substrate-binding protein n=1 Tax=Macrococcoides caseolyticum TaxID=69966 RepID=UPI001F2B6AF2|nr:molybdate ABC transporter substrate-binding protein [Macrococcus caseolyticus]MCE4956543.1 molybdate ABC transporter substrate-binding protein [Macrococcus caseolyticus]